MNDSGEGEAFRDSIGTINKAGDRVWVYPKMPVGFFYTLRKWISFVLVTFLFAMPFIYINGRQLFLFNVLERKFHFFGTPFWAQDFHLLVIMILLGVVFVGLFTVAFGRVFCGWICPQTIFLEFIFRPIEYWIEGDRGAQIRLDKQDWNFEKIRKKVTKWFLFFIISFLISNIFLAYFIGSDVLIGHVLAPLENIKTLLSLLIFTMVFYFVFAWFREQVCVIACPYGRLQGVLLDQHSLVVAYDYKRGEKEVGRAKFKKNEDRESSGKGDCIDCHQCVNVCPTGIDIRNGTQLECVNCTACMDACDEIMEAVKLPKKLIRHASEDQIQKEESFRFTSRLKGYTIILGIFILGFIFIITSRSEIEATLLRIPGQLYSISKDKNTIQNVYAYKFVNKTTADFQNIELKLISHQGHIYTANHQSITLKKEEIQDGTFFIELDKKQWKGKKLTLKIGLYNGENLIESVNTQFLGPRTYQ